MKGSQTELFPKFAIRAVDYHMNICKGRRFIQREKAAANSKDQIGILEWPVPSAEKAPLC